MASSLEIMHRSQKLTSTGHYPPPPSSPQRRFLPAGALAASAQPPNIVHRNKTLHLGFPGRHTWAPASSSPNSLLGNRIQRLNLRLSAPTPGEEELCRHWMKNSAKHCRNQNTGGTKTINRAKKMERPRTVETTTNRPHKELLPQRPKTAGKRRTILCMTSDSDQTALPSASQKSSLPAGIRKLGNNFPASKRYSSFDRTEVPRNSPTNELNEIYHENVDARSHLRPPSARPNETRWRNKARASYSPENLRSGSAGKAMGNTETRRWSLSDVLLNQQNDSKDDDSAYSSSREVIENADRVPGNSPDPVGPPPRLSPNIQSRDEYFHASSSTKIIGYKGQSSSAMVSGQDGRPVLYYHRNKRQADNYQPVRHNQSAGQNLLPLRRTRNTLQRPMTQPAMGTQHSRNTYQRFPTQRLSQENPEDKLIQRTLPPRAPVNFDSKQNLVECQVGSKFYPISFERGSDLLFKQKTATANEQSRLNSINQYIEPEVGRRIIQWLAAIEQNPEIYYGFETDLFGDSIQSSDSK